MRTLLVTPAQSGEVDLSTSRDAASRVARCRRVLAGEDDEGTKVHASMFDEGVISFAQGEGMRRPHPTVVAAGVRALLDTEISALDDYLFLQRMKPLDEAIAQFFMAEGIDTSTAGNICVDSGTTRLFLAFLHAVSNRGDAFGVAPTYYHPLADWCELADVRLVCVPTRRSQGYKLTRQDLEDWHERRARTGSVRGLRGLFLFNPTQTGEVYTREDLEGIATFVAAHDLLVLEDCIFTLTEYDPLEERHHLVSCEGMRERVVTISGASKAHGLANVRVGWGCGPRSIIDKMTAFGVLTSATTPQIAKLMALAALKVPREYHLANASEARDRAALIINLIATVNREVHAHTHGAPGEGIIQVEHVPRAGHSILLSFDGMRGLQCPDGTVVADSVDVARFFLREANVALAPGLANGFDGCQMRLCFACVGLRHTYASSHAAEVTAALEEVVACGSRAGLGRLREICLAPTATHRSASAGNSGFSEGRALIRTALLDRIGPALTRLVTSNRTRHPEGPGAR
jgi:aspartate aminotransferase